MTFTTPFKGYVCDGDSITCEVNGFTATARIQADGDTGAPDKMQDGFWPSKDEKDAGYCPSEHFDKSLADATEAMRAWKAGEWFYCGVCVVVEKNGVQLTGKYSNALWGIEANYPGSDNSYLLEVANELIDVAIVEAKAKLVELAA